MSASKNNSRSLESSARHSFGLAILVLLVRLRFILVLAVVLLLVGSWPVLRAHWQRLTQPSGWPNEASSLNMEYWCPMCPGVVSDAPGKCPVCHMILIRREKGEPTPLPDGVVARMQFSPYRVQLAGIRTAAVEYRPLLREFELVGTVTQVESNSVSVEADVFKKDLPFLARGYTVEASSDLLPGHVPFAGEITAIESTSAHGDRCRRVRLKIDDPKGDLHTGMILTACLETPIMRLGWWRQAVAEEGRKRTSVELAARCLLVPAGPVAPGGLESLLRMAVAETLGAKGVGLAVPQSAVLDHGARKVAFVESGTGMFDAVEVTVGPCCGGFYPVLRGVEAGQRVAVAGAFLLDAEMWLNHGVAATYFGATRSASSTPAPLSSPPDSTPVAPTDHVLAARQKVCPVTGEPLDSMGGPVRVEVAGKIVFVCCKGCEAPLRKNPEKYLSKLTGK